MRTVFSHGADRAALRIAFLRSGVALAALAAPTSAFAAADAAAADATVDAGEEYGEEILVTARRREETAQDVPIALSVVSAQTLERSGNFTLNQIQQLVPTLQVSGSNPRNSNINIRGLGANSAAAAGDGLEYGVGFYVDGVYYGRPGQSQFDLIDLAQIEVLRGPQGTLFGKNTTAGALNITTREPSFEPELTVEGNIGNYQYHQVRATGSIPIVADKVAVRLSVADTHRDGYLTNLYDGTDAQNYDNFTARGQLLIKPNDDIKIRIIGDYSKQKLDIILNVIDGYYTKYANGATIAYNIFDRAARTGYVLPDQNAFSRNGNSNSPFGADSKGYGVSGQIDWDLGSATLTSITAHRWWDWFPKNDVDGTPLSINIKGQQQNFQRQFSQELRIASNGENKIDYVAGLFYFWQKVRGYGEFELGRDFAEWNLNPAAPANTPTVIANTDLALTNFQGTSFSDPQTRSYAAFGQADWHITSGLTLTAGLRFTHEDKKGSYWRAPVAGSGLDLSGLSAEQLAAITAIRNNAAYQMSPIAFSARLKDDAFSGLVSLSYKVTPDVLLYGSYSRGSKSGGLNLTAGAVARPLTDTTDPNKRFVVEPEKVDAFEVGVKSQFLDDTLTFNVAAFLTEITDYQANVSQQVPGTTSTTQYIDNIPKVRSKGVEADIAYAPTEWITLSAAGAYTDAKFVSFANSPQAPEKSNQGGIQDLSGVRLTGVSKFAYSVSADVAQPINEDAAVYVRGDWLHRSSFNSSAVNSIYGVIPAYGILNARLGLRNERFDVSVWARNLFDKDYYASRSGGTFGLLNGTPGDPRTIGATLRVNW